MLEFKNWVIVLATVLLPVSVFSQETEIIWSPGISYSWKNSDRWAYKTQLSMFNSVKNLDDYSAIEYIEPQFSFSYGMSVRTKIGGGYYYRWVSPLLSGYAYEHRLLEQVGFISYLGDRRIAHRFRLEQRFRSSTYQHRIRYRLSYDFPLDGDQLDPGEKYLLISNEMMTAFNKNNADAENRALIGLGWFFSNKQKFELGLQYRTQDIFSGNGINHLIRISTSFYLNR